MNLIAFLQRQNYQLERAVQALRGVEGLLAGARWVYMAGLSKSYFLVLTSSDLVLHDAESAITT
jgi:hypothetical protein